MSRNRVMVEVVSGKITRICKRMEPIHGGELKEWPRAEAVKSIRQQVFERSQGDCEWCSGPISWKTMELHEVIYRSRGGEIGTANSVALCYSCHHNDAHGDRRLRFGEVDASS